MASALFPTYQLGLGISQRCQQLPTINIAGMKTPTLGRQHLLVEAKKHRRFKEIRKNRTRYLFNIQYRDWIYEQKEKTCQIIDEASKMDPPPTSRDALADVDQAVDDMYYVADLAYEAHVLKRNTWLRRKYNVAIKRARLLKQFGLYNEDEADEYEVLCNRRPFAEDPKTYEVIVTDEAKQQDKEFEEMIGRVERGEKVSDHWW